MLPSGLIAKLSNDRLPTARRLTTWIGSLVTPVTLSTTTGPLICTGSINSYKPPAWPFSLATMIVPHGVRRTGSHELKPVMMVVALLAGGPERSTRWTAGFDVSSSHTNTWVG